MSKPRQNYRKENKEPSKIHRKWKDKEQRKGERKEAERNREKSGSLAWTHCVKTNQKRKGLAASVGRRRRTRKVGGVGQCS